MNNNTFNNFITESDISLFLEGKNFYSYKFMGAHYKVEEEIEGYRFTVWAPNCEEVRVVGDFNNWNGEKHSMKNSSKKGFWSLFIKYIHEGELYKYEVINSRSNSTLKSDPYSFLSEKRPKTASITVKSEEYNWDDHSWLIKRKTTDYFEKPLNIYEVHLGSFLKDDNGEFLNYRILGDILSDYVNYMGYTHIEIMPITEYPLDDSWGYQVTGYFSPTSRFGDRNDLKYFIQCFHKKGIGVILDWVPGHFCKDEHGLYKFDGSCQYEYDDPLMYENIGWGTANFNLRKGGVRSFLISNAFYWIEEFHFDGLRIDAVANMIYLDFNKSPGRWIPSKDGGNENIEAKDFLRELNLMIFNKHSGVFTLAEESTAMPYVTSKDNPKGLGFDFKWNMGWMNDVLKYIEMEPAQKSENHNLMTFSMTYTYYENFMLPISHDEVVYGKRSLLQKMPGDEWNKFAGLRCFLAFMYCHPGKKTLFMGSEFGQVKEWNFQESLDFYLLEDINHKKTQVFSKALNEFYKSEKSLWERDFSPEGFQWIDADNRNQSVIIFMRKSYIDKNTLIVVCNFTSKIYYDYRIGVPFNCSYKEVFNTDEERFGGIGETISEILFATAKPYHNQKYSIKIKVPPMATIVLKVYEG